jgi:hypothetical protein
MGNFQKISSNCGAIPRNAEERQDFVELGAFELIRAFFSGRPWESGVTVQFVWQNQISWYKIAYFQKRSSMADRMVNPWLFCFHPNFAENYRQNQNMGCIDASRHQLQSVIKSRV